MKTLPEIDPKIERATTLPGWFYSDAEWFEKSKEAVFARSWQPVEQTDFLKTPGSAQPFFFMENLLDEPLLLVHDDDGEVRCLSNVCTHRGNILVENSCRLSRGIVCNYHGRRFNNRGEFQTMPKCEGMENFPSEADNLASLPIKKWRQFFFTGLHPTIDFSELIREMDERTAFLPIDDFLPEPALSQDYLVKANWALYCDNFLEGFHVPFIHPTLAAELNWADYETHLFRWSNLQIGIGKGGEHCFSLPPSHPDFGKKVAGYYFWLFPNLMFNFYPWGLSMNIVRPLETGLTRVSFRSYVWKKGLLGKGAGADLHRIELEDEAVVERVQLGTASRFYQKGRFSPSMERGVHQFHRLLAGFLAEK